MQGQYPLILVVLDGWGQSDSTEHNAVFAANIPTWQHLWSTCPHTLLSASGLDVGLPPDQMGNSEVGHMTIGSGRVIYQDLTRINLAISDGTFFTNHTLKAAVHKAADNEVALHILGLLSPGGVHSHEDHIHAMIQMAKDNNVKKIYLHAFLDGRDTPPKSATASINKFAPYIASLMGRFYAMDRDKRLERTHAAIDLLIHGNAAYVATNPLQALQEAYLRGETDEFVAPTKIQPVTIKPNDVVVCMNFRTDRMRQLCHALIKALPAQRNNLVTLTAYDQQLPAKVAFPPITVSNTLSQTLAEHKLTQLHIAETEKYAHVTFFFNAGLEETVPGEDRVLIQSPQVTTYDLQPAMSALEITEVLIAAIINKTYDVIICNYANADMVGHTGNMTATVQALEAIDNCLTKLFSAIKQHGGSMLITSDHGNAETMWDKKTKQPHTAHTTNLVPLIYVGPKDICFKTDKIYGLQDIAPTILELLHVAKPAAMTGISLISQE